MRFRTRLTLVMTAILIVGGTLFMTMAEWANLDTLGAFDPGAMNTGTLLGTDVLVFIGGGSAGTAGGIKVGTFAALLLAIAMTSVYMLDQILYEVVSAFATVGLSTGITADLAPGHQLIVITLMFAGRFGPVTLASALVLREHGRLFPRPEGPPLIG